jgi:hypothetical protein
MSSDETCIELRIAGSGHPYVAVLGGRSAAYGFERLFNPFPRRRVRLPDGRKEEIHSLPDADLTYEVEEVRDGQRVRWYAATLEGDPDIHHITRYGAEIVAKRVMSIREVIREYPEMPSLELEED